MDTNSNEFRFGNPSPFAFTAPTGSSQSLFSFGSPLPSVDLNTEDVVVPSGFIRVKCVSSSTSFGQISKPMYLVLRFKEIQSMTWDGRNTTIETVNGKQYISTDTITSISQQLQPMNAVFD